MPPYDWGVQKNAYSPKPDIVSGVKGRNLDRLLAVPINDIETVDPVRLKEVDDLYKVFRFRWKKMVGIFQSLVHYEWVILTRDKTLHFGTFKTIFFSNKQKSFICLNNHELAECVWVIETQLQKSLCPYAIQLLLAVSIAYWQSKSWDKYSMTQWQCRPYEFARKPVILLFFFVFFFCSGYTNASWSIQGS